MKRLALTLLTALFAVTLPWASPAQADVCIPTTSTTAYDTTSDGWITVVSKDQCGV